MRGNRMCAAIRPVAITAVGLVGAAVIVANPIRILPADVRVPAMELSATRIDVLDSAFLTRIGAADPVSTDPVGLAQQLVDKLVNNATDTGKATVAAAFAAGVVAATDP